MYYSTKQYFFSWNFFAFIEQLEVTFCWSVLYKKSESQFLKFLKRKDRSLNISTFQISYCIKKKQIELNFSISLSWIRRYILKCVNFVIYLFSDWVKSRYILWNWKEVFSAIFSQWKSILVGLNRLFLSMCICGNANNNLLEY